MGGDTPTPPDPVITAQTQGAANDASTRLTTQLNRPTQTTPFGTVSWTQAQSQPVFDEDGYNKALAAYQAAANAPRTTVTQGENGPTTVDAGPFTGVAPTKEQFTTTKPSDQWTSTSTLSPELQGILNSIMGGAKNAFNNPAMTEPLPDRGNVPGSYQYGKDQLSQYAPNILKQGQQQQGVVDQTQANAVKANTAFGNNISQPFNYDSVTAGMPAADAARFKQVADAYYGQQTSRLDPQFAQSENKIRTDLMNRGLTEGSDAWKTQMDNFSRGKTDAYSTAQNTSIQNAGADQSRQFADQLSARQQGVTEANTIRNQATNEALAAQALNSGSVGDLAKLAATGTAQSQAVDSSAAGLFNMQQALRGSALNEQNTAQAQQANYLSMMQQLMGLTPGASAQSGSSATAAPYAQAIQNAYAGQVNSANAQNSSNASLLSALGMGAGFFFGGPAGAAAGGAIGGSLGRV